MAAPFQILFRIFLPSLMPAIVTVALFAFITSWNEFLGAIVMMSRESAFTLPRHPRRGADRDEPRAARTGGCSRPG